MELGVTRFYWLIDAVERACYEILPDIHLRTDLLRTDLFTLKVSDIFPDSLKAG